jgi:hypothetical protein
MTVGRSAAAALVALSLVAATGCGGAKKTSTPSPQQAASDLAPLAPKDDLALPPGVPDRATGPATDASRRVINNWLKELRHGHIKAAAHFFALPSKFQNATPVLTIDSAIEKLAIQKSLPCGAKIKKANGPAPFVVLVFTLTNRPGSLCGTAAGHSARGAIRVAHGHIAEWYRLPDDPRQPEPDSAITQDAAAA